ncbi:hypothetical protein KsCSTR_45840 [Candidatus Kuenenia stuttgartiensis]|uniref:Uncharacterized protein n=1 Tax=Kuenenia stuttgartiensis TaxID=174633 RepID=Q1PWG2_KUEST|nr:hypothetical protein KsCSTR_45840 [Candidatus Kuenenia stuttgartiensis]CAJ71558.1 unknown protein [Candidatus Kuenenia stuttgartiensis]
MFVPHLKHLSPLNSNSATDLVTLQRTFSRFKRLRCYRFYDCSCVVFVVIGNCSKQYSVYFRLHICQENVNIGLHMGGYFVS